MEHYHKAKHITILGIILNVALSVLKLFFGVFGHSAALVADGIHSVSDLVVDSFVLFAMKTGRRPPDEKHPYGHGRIETVFTAILSLVLIFTSVGIIFDGIETILRRVFLHPAFSVLVVATISLIVNEGLYRLTVRIGKQYKSSVLQANAWHRRSDALSSLVVLIGVGGAMLNIHYLDAIAAMIVALLILKIGFKLGWQAIRELIDTGVDRRTYQSILQAVGQMPGVISVHKLRTRSMAGLVFVDVHIQVPPRISVSEGHYVADQVNKQLKEQFKGIADVVVHVDVEPDVLSELLIGLPARESLEKQIQSACIELPFFGGLQNINLHYLNRAIEVELIFSCEVLSKVKDIHNFISQYELAIKQFEVISSIDIFFGKC